MKYVFFLPIMFIGSTVTLAFSANTIHIKSQNIKSTSIDVKNFYKTSHTPITQYLRNHPARTSNINLPRKSHKGNIIPALQQSGNTKETSPPLYQGIREK